MGAPLGNKNGANGKQFRQALRRALAHKHGSVEDGLLAVARKLVEAAEQGEMAALKEIADREDGKPAQTLGGDPEGVPLQLETIQRVLVKPKD